MSVTVTLKPKGLTQTREKQTFEGAESFIRTNDGRIELYDKDGSFIGEVRKGIWDSVVVED